MVASIEVDRRDPRVRRLEQRQAVGHAGRGPWAAVRIPDGRLSRERLLRLVQVDHLERVVRGHIQDACLGIHGRPGPTHGASRARAQDRALRPAILVERNRLEEGAPAIGLDRLDGGLAKLRRKIDQVVDRHALTIEGRRFRREGLRRPNHLAGHVGLRIDRAFLDGPNGFAGRPVEHIGEALLRYLGDRLDLAAVDVDVDEVWMYRKIVVPQTMMDRLEMPHSFARLDVDGNERLGEQIRAEAVTTIEVIGHRTCRGVENSELLVTAVGAPNVRVA